MYAIKIEINTDGDFGFDDNEFNLDLRDEYVEQIFYFKNREDAALALNRHLASVVNTLRTYDRNYINNWFHIWRKHIKLISRKFDTFIVEKDFGNQSVLYELVKADKFILPNNSTTYKCEIPYINFSNYDEELIDWDEINNMEDLKL